MALLLAGLAGWVDATGLSLSGGVFVSFMSGNTTDLGVALSHGDWLKLEAIGGVIILFVAGVIIGETIGRWTARYGHAVVLGLEAVLLATGAAVQWQVVSRNGGYEYLALYPLVLAMGTQNATMHRAAGLSVSLTYVTGTLVQMGRALAHVGQPESRQRACTFLCLWLSLAAGSSLAVLMLSISMVAALAAAAAMATTLAVTTALVTGRALAHPT